MTIARALAAGLGVMLLGCSDPTAQTSETGSSSGGSSSSGSTEGWSSTGSGSSAPPTTSESGTTGQTTSTSTSTATSTSTSTSTSTTADPTTDDISSSSSSSSSSSGGTPASCGPPCDETWEHEGDLNIWMDPGDFTCLTRVHGNLWIANEADPAVVATLANLRRVDDTLQLYGPASLTDLSTFSCLEEVGRLAVIGLPQLADMTGLAGLRAAPDIILRDLAITALPAFAPDFAGIQDLTLQFNPALTDLSAASDWGEIGEALQIDLWGNGALADLSGLAGLITENQSDDSYVQIIDHPALTSLAGLESITSGTLYLQGLPLVTDLDPLAQMTTAGSITLIDLPKVTSLAGLGGLETAYAIMIGDCVNAGTGGMEGLTSLAGLASLTSVESLAIANNVNLTSLAGAPLLTSVGGLEVVNNPALTQAAYDAFVAQLDAPPPGCFGDWNTCQCFEILPW